MTPRQLILLTIFFISAVTTTAQFQFEKNAVGVRLGPYFGGTFQTYLSDEQAIELIMTTRYRGIVFTGLYEIHKAPFDLPGLQWYYGGGVHIGMYPSYTQYNALFYEEQHYNKTFFGLDGIVGIEYFIDNIPVVVSLDWKPAVNFHPIFPFEPDHVALSGRYTF